MLINEKVIQFKKLIVNSNLIYKTFQALKYYTFKLKLLYNFKQKVRSKND